MSLQLKQFTISERVLKVSAGYLYTTDMRLVDSRSSSNDGSETNTNSEYYNLVHHLVAPPQFTAHKYVHIVRLN